MTALKKSMKHVHTFVDLDMARLAIYDSTIVKSIWLVQCFLKHGTLLDMLGKVL